MTGWTLIVAGLTEGQDQADALVSMAALRNDDDESIVLRVAVVVRFGGYVPLVSTALLLLLLHREPLMPRVGDRE